MAGITLAVLVCIENEKSVRIWFKKNEPSTYLTFVQMVRFRQKMCAIHSADWKRQKWLYLRSVCC